MKIAVIGGGPAGMMCAGQAAENKDNDVYLFEKNNSLGRKLLLTGHGRCNLTNVFSGQDFLCRVTRNPKFLMSAESKFGTKEIREFFESHNVPLKEEEGGRIFPASEKSIDVLNCLEEYLKNQGVTIELNSEVTGIKQEDDIYKIKINQKYREFDAVVISTGGVSYPETGSTGDGYKFADGFEIERVEPKPSLTAIELADDVGVLEGISIKNATLNVVDMFGKKIATSGKGDFLFYDKGTTGPISFTISSLVAREDIREKLLLVDFCASRTNEEVENRINLEIKSGHGKQILSIIKSYMPTRLAEYFLHKIGIDTEKRCNQITKNERFLLSKNLKGFPFEIKGLEPISRAFVTAGGIDVSEINPKTMESKQFDNLFFIGEVLDVDAITGGNNLSIAFMTGAVAGKYLAE